MLTDYSYAQMRSGSGKALADMMRVDVAHLVWLAKDANNQWSQGDVPKKKGGTRSVYSPSRVLRQAQAWLLSNVLETVDASQWAKAYGRGSSTLLAVSPHAGNLTVIRVDFSDFFGHIKNYDVRAQFVACGLTGVAADIATDICCLNGSLPQGGITSPCLSNLAMRKFDTEAAKLVKQWHGIYTRYGDDLIVSFASTFGKEATQRFIASLSPIAERHGQEINPSKTNVMLGAERKSALGIVFTQEVSMYRKARRTFRAMCHNLETTLNNPRSFTAEEHAELSLQKNRILGMYAYMKMIDAEHAQSFSERYPWLDDK